MIKRNKQAIAISGFVLAVAAVLAGFKAPVMDASERLTRVTTQGAWDYISSSSNYDPVSLLGWLILIIVCVAAWALGTKATSKQDSNGG